VLLFCFPAFGQSPKIDSLRTALRSAQDTNKVRVLNELSRQLFLVGNYDSALTCANQALELVSAKFQAQPDELIRELKNLRPKEGTAGLFSMLSRAYNNVGNVYNRQGNYPRALENFYAALKTAEAIGDKKSIANSYNNIGLIKTGQNNNAEALENHLAALKLRQEIGDKQGIAASYNNIGNVHSRRKNFAEALKSHEAALKIREEIADKRGIANSYGNIGKVHYSTGNAEEALKNHFIALKIREAIGDKEGLASSYGNIGNTYLQQNKITEASEYLGKCLQLALTMGSKEFIQDSYASLSDVDSIRGDWQAAYRHYKLSVVYRDSLLNEENTAKTVQQQMNYEFDKKEAASRAEQEKKDAVTDLIIYSVSAGLLLVLLLAVFIFWSYSQKKKANVIISQQKEEVEKQKDLVEEQKKIVEEKNKDITDSITYAQRIQQAKLPRNEQITASLPQSFVLFKPKDIVSGDFYFFDKNERTVFLAAADCTGHGVPGAFMSLIGYERLDDAVQHSSDTSEILTLLNKGIKASLRQSDSDQSTRDGMDIALCAIDTQTRRLKFSGANRPLWIVRKNTAEMEELKGTKKAIGGLTEDEQRFEAQEVQLAEGDTFYLFSDGYADLFGGAEGKKLTTKKFKEILLGIQHLSMTEQGAHLERFASEWRGQTEQVDDILVIGVRL